VAEKGDAQLAVAPARRNFSKDFSGHDNRKTFFAHWRQGIGSPCADAGQPSHDRSEQRKTRVRCASPSAQGNGDRGRTSRGLGWTRPAREFQARMFFFQLVKNTNISAARPKGVLILKSARISGSAKGQAANILIVTGCFGRAPLARRRSGGDDFNGWA